jgi:peptide-methionine (S)-S-oxide reductase
MGHELQEDLVVLSSLASLFGKKLSLPTAAEALPGRDQAMPVPSSHTVLKAPLVGPFPAPMKTLLVGMGCFWGAERKLWQQPGVYTTAVGYAGGFTKNPTYEEVCSGGTGHTEVVLVVYDPARISTAAVLKVFWENHDPTQGMRQGNDTGTQYRSALYYSDDEQRAAIEATRAAFQAGLTAKGYGAITTEVRPVVETPLFYAEAYHQQYLDKNPGGYCGLAGTGVSCAIGTGVSAG